MKNTKLIDDSTQEAAEWFLKTQGGNMTEADYLTWQEWLAENDTNQQAFAKAEDCWHALDAITTHRVTQGTINRFMPMMAKVAAGIAASLIIALSIGFFYQSDHAVPLQATTYQTDRAEHKIIQLEDGSKINLGAKSIINVSYDDAERHITLVRGEAVFDVTKDKNRPFVVKTGKGTATAIGTKFNIHTNDHNVVVTVIEGLVEVNPDPGNMDVPRPRVSAGKAISYQSNGHISEITATNVDAATSWEKGLLVRVDTPLYSVIEDVNRYSSREIIIGDPDLNNIKFTGTILNDGIDNWLQGLSIAYPIIILDSGQDAILLLKKQRNIIN